MGPIGPILVQKSKIPFVSTQVLSSHFSCPLSLSKETELTHRIIFPCLKKPCYVLHLGCVPRTFSLVGKVTIKDNLDVQLYSACARQKSNHILK